MQREQLAQLFRQVGLGRVSDPLVALAAPTIWAHPTTATEAAVPIGASKLGGRPDLPAGTDWPAWHESMAFLAQFNLAETAPCDLEHALPAGGLLSFFYETNGEPLYAELWGQPEPRRPEDYPEDADPRSWQVLYFPDDPATFFRRVTPGTVNAGGRFPNCAIRFTTEWTTPDAGGPEVEALGLTAAERRALIHVDADINRGTWDDPGIRLLGYPYNMDGSTLVECDFEARGIHNVLWHRVTPEHRPQLQREAAQRWRLLLQLTGGRAFPRNWGGNGVLHCCIERTALAAHDFGRVWFNMQLL